jgi:hypothetical protein
VVGDGLGESSVSCHGLGDFRADMLSAPTTTCDGGSPQNSEGLRGAVERFEMSSSSPPNRQEGPGRVAGGHIWLESVTDWGGVLQDWRTGGVSSPVGRGCAIGRP